MKKSLGQNFLTDKNVVKRIVDSADLDANTFVLEVGGGRGNLTDEIVKRTKNVTIIETDEEFYSILTLKYQKYETVRIVLEDAKVINYPEILESDRKYRVLANLPYNQAIPILMKLLANYSFFDEMVLMFQKEVADRIVANQNNKVYGVLSVKVYPVATVKRMFLVSPGSFYPAPKVMSAVVKFKIREKPLIDMKNFRKFSLFVQKAFSHRRKTFLNSVKDTYPPEVMKQILVDVLKLPESVRPEAISKQQYVDMFNHLVENNLI